jgi:hypothetical protein
MKTPYAGLTVLWLTIAVASSMLLGQSKRPYDVVAIKFCPQTANLTPKFGKEFSQRSQEKLDQKYCRYEHKLLKEIWEQKQFESSVPIPESSLIIREIPASESRAMWFLVSPIAAGVAYLSWAKKSELNEKSAHDELEGYKTEIKAISVYSRNERDFKSRAIASSWDKQRVKAGQISLKGMQDRLQCQQEFQEKTHTSALKQFDLADSEMDKKIAENLRDKHKAEKESQKLVGIKNEDSKHSSDAKKQLIKALKEWEDGWLWYLVESFTPIIIYGKAGSYKSYTAACFALLKHYLIAAKIESIADTDFEQNKSESWKYLVPLEPQIYASGIDWESYNEGYLEAIERSKIRTLKDTPIVSIWDELTNAKGKFENAPNIVPFVIATPRKRNEHCILLAHQLTQDCLGGCSGMSDAIQSQTYRLNLKSNRQSKPLFKGVLEGFVDDQGEELEQHKVSLPDWLRPEIIWNHFNGKLIQFEG